MAIWSWHPLDAIKWRERQPAAISKLRHLWRTNFAFRVAVVIGILGVLFIFPTLATAFLLAALAALLGLILQTAVNPSLVAWAVPWEAVKLFLNRRARTNHAWNHRVQSLVREAGKEPAKADGFADREGFFLFAEGLDKTQVQEIALAAWDELVQQAEEKPVHGCKTIRFLLTALLCAAGALLLQFWRDLELPSALLCIAISIVLAAMLAPSAEKLLGRFAETRAWQEEKAGANLIQVRPVEIPQILFFRGGSGFSVRRKAAGSLEQRVTASGQSAPAAQPEPQTRTEQEVKPESLEPWVV